MYRTQHPIGSEQEMAELVGRRIDQDVKISHVYGDLLWERNPEPFFKLIRMAKNEEDSRLLYLCSLREGISTTDLSFIPNLRESLTEKVEVLIEDGLERVRRLNERLARYSLN